MFINKDPAKKKRLDGNARMQLASVKQTLPDADKETLVTFLLSMAFLMSKMLTTPLGEVAEMGHAVFQHNVTAAASVMGIYDFDDPEDMPLFDAKKFPEVRADAYDVVLNGVEIGGGSMRIYEPPLQEKMFEALGITSEAQQAQFGHLLRALRLGAPPHGGIAFGLDRMVMLICGEQSIRDVMAFPKNNRGQELMTQSPAEVDPKQLRELGIQLATEKK